MSSFQNILALKAVSHSKALDDKHTSGKQRDCLVLIISHLQTHGFVQSASQLQKEIGDGILTKYKCADNIDLLQILVEFEEYHEIKYGRKPKFSCCTNTNKCSSATFSNSITSTLRDKRNTENSSKIALTSQNRTSIYTNKDCYSTTRLLPPLNTLNTTSFSRKHVRPNITKPLSHPQKHEKNAANPDVEVLGRNALREKNMNESLDDNQPSNEDNLSKTRVKPLLPFLNGDTELRNLAFTITQNILVKSPAILWEDIVGHDDAKELLKEAVILPLKYPQLFTGLLAPWRGVLLYGPPGTGKTMLAKAIATQSESTFFNISASSIVSKFRGDSEKMIKVAVWKSTPIFILKHSTSFFLGLKTTQLYCLLFFDRYYFS